MALKPCRECGETVSSGAKLCPHCGVATPIPKRSALAGFVLLIVVLAFVGHQNSVPVPTAAEAPPEPTPAPPKTGGDATFSMAVLGARSIKEAMRDPDSFKLVDVTIQKNNAICYTYRAKNGYGGMNLEYAVFSHDRKRFRSSSQEGFVGTWNKECGAKSGRNETANVRALL